MKIRGSKFWKFEGVMSLCAVVTCIIFQWVIALMSDVTHSISYHLCWIAILCLPQLIGGLITWKLSHEDNSWVELARRQIVFAGILVVIPTIIWSNMEGVDSPDMAITMLYNLIYIMCSILPIMLCGYLYHHWSEEHLKKWQHEKVV
ncbi:MAG: hypothetical protein KBG68_06425 [Prevotella sp.]|jgi:peptidoglycan/LPS O-acetylase OafA/YrhL|nr:hypothetical protein [Prevotella sp.]